MAAARFQTTNWSLVFAAGGSPDALNDLCARYWSPVYAYVRRCGHDRADAEDLTQAFFSRMLEHRDFAQADPRRGKFRSFLLGALKHFLSNERDRVRAKKRGGDVVHVEIDVDTTDDALTPEQVFEKQWALTVVERALRAGRFRIVTPLGRGGMGEVYRADDIKLGHAVALKFVPATEETLREVRAGRDIAHPNVCRIYDVVDVDANAAIVMELVDGEDLESLM